jgi:hypothetical protein
MFILQREAVAETSAIPNQQTWPVRITALAEDGVTPAKVFVYQEAAPPVADRDFFSCVAGAAQMTELPPDSPAEGVPYYRVHVMQVYARSPTHADEVWEKIQRAVQDLADNLNLVSALSVSETVTITPRT